MMLLRDIFFANSYSICSMIEIKNVKQDRWLTDHIVGSILSLRFLHLVDAILVEFNLGIFILNWTTCEE
jgi:hypothetical protein